MNETNKESKFLDAINQYAEKQKQLISGEVEEYKAQKIEQATEAGLKDAYELIQRDIAERKAALVTEFAQKENALRRELYAARSAITEQVFTEAAGRIASYTVTDAYRDALVRAAQEASAICGSEGCTVYLRPADMAIAADITAQFQSASAQEDAAIAVGGLRVLCEKKGVLIDDTLDTKLQEERRRFIQTSGLKVVS